MKGRRANPTPSARPALHLTRRCSDKMLPSSRQASLDPHDPQKTHPSARIGSLGFTLDQILMKADKMTYRTFLAIGSLFLFGCATTPKANLTGFEDFSFPATTLVFTSESMQYRENRQPLILALRESKAFKSIDIDNPYSKYALEINIEFGNKLDNIADALVTGAAIGAMVVPVQMEYIVTGTVTLRDENLVIDSFPLEFEHKRVQTLFHGFDKDGGWSGALRVAAQKIIEALKERGSYDERYFAIPPGAKKMAWEGLPAFRGGGRLGPIRSGQ